MKRFLLVMATIILLLMCASLGQAWEVRVKNSCNKDAYISVKGHHLFWEQIDCTTGVIFSGATKTCQMPGLICPTVIQGVYLFGGSEYDLKDVYCSGSREIPCCWNLNAEIVQMSKDSCRLELR